MEPWIVLGVGIATVLVGVATVSAQVLPAKQGSLVAGRQLAVLDATLRGDRTSVLVVARGRVDTTEAEVTVFNGGRFSAIDIRLKAAGPDGAVFASGGWPLIAPHERERVILALGSPEKREAFERCNQLNAE